MLTAVAFALVTAALVAWHVRKSRPSGAPAAPKVVTCPRCRVPVPSAARACPRCGVPPQVYEVVAAPKAEGSAEAPGGRLHAVVRGDVCVGCGACVAACPEAGAIAMDGKLAVVNPDACTAQGECVKACPVGGVFLSTGDAVQRVEVPEIDLDFESNVPGIFVAGELGGRGLIKNAINEGKLAAEAVARRVATGEAPEGNRLVHDVVIVGSGPAGLSAALTCQDRGLRYVVLEQGDAAESIRRYPRHKILLAEPVNLPLYGDLWVSDASKETLLGVWKNVIEVSGLDIRTGQKVTDVRRESWGFRVATEKTAWPARHVILALGRRGSPRKLEVPGEELPKVFYDIVEMDAFAGRRVLVVGGGDSAVESALGLCRQPGTRVHLSYRGEAFSRVKERNREKLEQAIAAKSLVPLLGTTVTEVLPDRVRLASPRGPVELPNDDVIVRIGGEPPTAFLDRIGVRRVVKELALLLVAGILSVTGASAQVSPGPLSKAHSSLEGNGHCLDCHATKSDGMDERCTSCHREIAMLREAKRGFHARTDASCAKCHPEHAGGSFQLIEWPGGGKDAFDHAKTGFDLRDKHASLKCAECHQTKFRKGKIAEAAKVKDAGRSFVGLDPSCASCHADPHKGLLGAECARCHGTADWKTTPGFDHQKTAFPLEAKHVGVACEKCHLPKGADKPVFKPLPHQECSACHADPHAGRLGPKCASCHTVRGFREVAKTAFDHDRTRYPLRGLHASVACAKCHDEKTAFGPKPAFARCVDCHRDPHRGTATLAGAKADCAACHTVSGFKPGVMEVAKHAPDRFPLRAKHAEVACAKCHRKGPQGTEIHPRHDACATCHEDAHHGELASRKDKGACTSCHDERGFRPSTFGVAAHEAVFPLEGKHRAADCAKCHRPAKLVLRGIPKTCVPCHQDPHKFAENPPCARCHDVDGWVPAKVGPAEHAKYAYPLEGTHAAVPCFACHKELTAKPRTALAFRDSRRRCAECHADPHAGQFPDCAHCHAVDTFRRVSRFDHDRDTKFRLGSAHARVACGKCHEAKAGSAGKPVVTYRGAPSKCEACHGRKKGEAS